MNVTQIGIMVFTVAALMGPWYTVESYNPVSNVISQLGAQNTPNNLIMVAGFLALGIGIMADGMRRLSKPVVPFIAFGLFMGLAGLLSHKPVSPDAVFNEFAHQAHSILATLAGISITVGLFWQAFLATSSRLRVITLTLAALCLVLPLCMLVFQDVQGIIQRVMYLFVFVWLWINYPDTIKTKRRRKTSLEK